MELGQLAPTMSDFDSLQVFDGLLGEGHDAGAFDVDVDCFSDETVSATASDGDAGGASEHDEPKIAVPVVKPAVGGVHSRQRSTSYDWMSSVSPLMGSSRLGGIGAGGFGVKSTTPLMEGLVLGPGAKPAPIKLGQGMWQQQHQQQQQQQQQVKRKSSGNGNKRSRAERDGIQGKANGHHGNNKATANNNNNNNNNGDNNNGDNKNGSSKANANANVNLGDGNPMIMGAIRSILSTGDPVAAQREAERLGMSARKRRRVTVTVGARQQQRQQQQKQQQQHRAQYLDEDDGHDQGESSETSEDTDDDAVLSFSSSITANVPFFGMDSHGNGSGSNSNTGRVTPTPEFRLSLGASPSMSPMRGDMLPHGHGGLPLKNLADFDAGAVAGRRKLHAREKARSASEKDQARQREQGSAQRTKAQRERERRERRRERERAAREKRRARERREKEREKKKAAASAQKERARKKRERDAANRQRKRASASNSKSSRSTKPGRMVPSGILLSADSLKLKLMLAKNLDLRIMSDAGCITPREDESATTAAASTTPRVSSPRVVLDIPGADRVGVYTAEERLAMVARFRTKRQSRIWRKKIKYSCRKKLADSRPRIKGRFVKRLPGEEPQTVARAEAKLAEMARQKEAAKAAEAAASAAAKDKVVAAPTTAAAGVISA